MNATIQVPAQSVAQTLVDRFNRRIVITHNLVQNERLIGEFVSSAVVGLAQLLNEMLKKLNYALPIRYHNGNNITIFSGASDTPEFRQQYKETAALVQIVHQGRALYEFEYD